MAVGNTIGKLQYAPKPLGKVNAGSANPPKKKSWWSKWGDWVHTGLDVLGAVPVVGIFADGANAALYAAEGNYTEAAISAASAGANFIPGGGAVFKSGKLVAKATVALGKKVVKEGAEQGAKKIAKEATEKAVKEGVETTTKKAGKAGSNAGGGAKGKGKSKPCKLKPAVGKPVNPVLGIKVLAGDDDLDFEFAALLPLSWQRSYYSDYHACDLLGQGWSLPFFAFIKTDADGLLYIDEQGREIEFPDVEPGNKPYLNRYESLYLSSVQTGHYQLAEIDGGMHWHFNALPLDDEKFVLTQMEDRHGNRLTISYNLTGLPESIIDSLGRHFKLYYKQWVNSEGEHLIRIDNIALLLPPSIFPAESKEELLVSYRYSDGGDLLQVISPQNSVLREFSYKNQLMVSHTQPGGLHSYYEYNQYTSQGKVIAHGTNLGERWQFDYAPGITTVTDALQRVTKYHFNENNEVTGFTDAAGGYTDIILNSWGKPLSVTHPAGQRTRYRYDGMGNITAVIAPDGTTTLVDYHDVWNLPTRTTDMLGHSTDYIYDVAGNLIREIDALAQKTEYNHDDAGNLIQIRDAKGGLQRIGYNRAGLPESHTDCSGQVTQYQWDYRGHLNQIIDNLSQTTRYLHNARGLLEQVQYPDKSIEYFNYDNGDRLITHIAVDGSKTEYTLDKDGLPLSRRNALNHSVNYQYDVARRLTQLTNENGAQYRFQYDVLDNLTAEQGFDDNLTHYQYDAASQLKEKREYGCRAEFTLLKEEDDKPAEADLTQPIETADTIRTYFGRDKAGRLIEKLVAKGGSKRWLRTRFGYDLNGQLITAINAGGRVELEYDAIGQLTKESSLTCGRTSVLQHQYDELGNRTASLLPDGKTLSQLYYGSGHLIQMKLDNRLITEIERDGLHREISRNQGKLSSHYQYDMMGRLTGQQADKNTLQIGSELPKIARRYDYSVSGELEGCYDLYSKQQFYSYDVLGRLTQTNNERFAFDPAHNLLDKDTDSAIKNNRVHVYQDKRFHYDAHGNLTEKLISKQTQQLFFWNAEHQLEKVIVNRNGVSQTTEYGYDAFGRRNCKKDSFSTTYFCWDGNRLLSETRGNKTHTYLYEQDSFAPLAQVESYQDEPTEQAIIRWYHNDQIGMPTELSTTEGNLAWRAEYSAWGNVLALHYPEIEAWKQEQQLAYIKTIHQPLRYQGQYYDAETELHYNRFRYYDPDIGRFIRQDPIGLAGGDNSYQYAVNPLSWVDPLGLKKKKCNDPCAGIDAASEAMGSQGIGNEPYVGVDSYTNAILKKGSVIYSLTPGGVPGFAVPIGTLLRAKGSVETYHDLVQVTPYDMHGNKRSMRANVQAYYVSEDTCIAKGRAKNNKIFTNDPHTYPGGGLQYYIPKSERGKLFAKKVRSI